MEGGSGGGTEATETAPKARETTAEAGGRAEPTTAPPSEHASAVSQSKPSEGNDSSPLVPAVTALAALAFATIAAVAIRARRHRQVTTPTRVSHGKG